MKRGRPNKRASVYTLLVETLGSINSPMTISAMARLVSEKLGTRISWNTVQKYTQELVETNRIQAVALPHSKEAGKPGLTVYTLKR